MATSDWSLNIETMQTLSEEGQPRFVFCECAFHWGIMSLGDHVHRAQQRNRPDLQSTDGEDTHQGCLLATVQIETPNDRHWKNDDSKVGTDVDGCISTVMC